VTKRLWALFLLGIVFHFYGNRVLTKLISSWGVGLNTDRKKHIGTEHIIKYSIIRSISFILKVFEV